MRLNYIELHGFKSFPDRIRIAFDKPFTAVVGPNGSGKSNISDAVRWVLGEQSSKSLRGDKMEDVIFSGTQLRNAMGFASVTLSISNEDKRLADTSDELLVSRRYYRSGDSEYLINGTTVRLRDVRELFMDTGLGRDGYSIIGQGRISEIVSARSSDRREIFEEAAGIAKYRFRKNEADRKLAAAEDNLLRTSDMLNELGSRVGPLEAQSKKAKRFLELAGEKRGLEITLFCDEIRRKNEQLRENSDAVATARADRELLDEKLGQIRAQLEHNSELTRGYSVRIDENYVAITERKQSAAEYRNELSVALNDIEHNRSQIQRLSGEREVYDSQQQSVEESEARIEADIAGKNEELTAQNLLISDAKERLSQLILDNEAVDRRRAESAESIARLTTEMTEFKVETVTDRNAIDANNARIETISAGLSAQSEQKAAFDAERESERKLLEGIDEKLTDAVNRKSGYEEKRKNRKSAFDETQSRLNALSFATDEAGHRLKALRELERSMAGFSESVKCVMSAKNARELRGVVGTVASLISINNGCETAIETALGQALQNIVVETESDAKSAIQHLKNKRAGRATFLPIETIKPSRFDGAIVPGRDGVVDIADRLVSGDKRYSDIFSFLLGRTVVAEDIDAASVVAAKLNHRYRVVTLDGQVINAGGSYTGGYVSRTGDILTRRGEIEALENKIVELDKSRESVSAELKKLFSELQTLDAEITALDADCSNLSLEKMRTETVISERLRETLTWQKQYDELVEERERLTEENLRLGGRLEYVEKSLTDKQDELARLNAAADKTADSADYIIKRTELQDELTHLRIHATEIQKDIESLASSLKSLSERRDDTDKLSNELNERISELAVLNEERQTRAQELRELAEGADRDAAVLEEEITECMRMRTLKEQDSSGLKRTENEIIELRDRSGSRIASLETAREALTADQRKFDDRLWEEYELTRIEAQKLCVPFENITSLRNRVGELRSAIKSLGTVNVASIDEYVEVSAKYEEFKKQYDDVDSSRKELIKLINSLTAEMRTLFEKSFAEINERFSGVFTELFGGGHARLYLSDENDILDSGIEMDVQPPGKVIKNLSSLSGGEQALVAIALYFAMLEVNPSPFCVLDEIDSALDDANVARFAQYLRHATDKTQFIAITHRRGTMEESDVLYGVTMQEKGVSRLLKLDIENIDAKYIG